MHWLSAVSENQRLVSDWELVSAEMATLAVVKGGTKGGANGDGGGIGGDGDAGVNDGGANGDSGGGGGGRLP